MGEVLAGAVVPADGAGKAVSVPQHVIDSYLPETARQLIVKGIPATTLRAYAWQWHLFKLWCAKTKSTYAPVHQNTMIRYLDDWRRRPVHVRCICSEHRPAPSTMWLWYSAVKFYHGVGDPPLPWECGENLSRAMIGYASEMVELGWVPRKAPRAYDSDVTRMIDALDLSTGKGLRDRALILTNFYTAARAADLATYRIADITNMRKGIEFHLRQSKTNRQVGKKVETRRMFTNNLHKQYDGVRAVAEYRGWLAGQGVTAGALFRPFDKHDNLRRGVFDAPTYKISGVNCTLAVQTAAREAGLPNWKEFTCHSLRRGRATQQRELGMDPIEIARAYGWVPGGAILVYLEEAEGWSPQAPGAVGML